MICTKDHQILAIHGTPQSKPAERRLKNALQTSQLRHPKSLSVWQTPLPLNTLFQSQPLQDQSLSISMICKRRSSLRLSLQLKLHNKTPRKKPLFSTTLELAEQGGSKNTQQEITVEEISLHALVGLNTVVGSLFRGVVERAFPAYLTALTFPLDAVLLTQQPYRRTSRQQDLFPVTRFSFQASKNVAAAWSTNFAKAQVAFLKRMGCTEGLTKVVESHSTRFHVNPFF